MMTYVELRNGMKIPQIGLGTWQITDRQIMKTVLEEAGKNGYQLLDTAAAYSNEIAISKAIAAAGISREAFIISDKLWNTCRGYKQAQDACRRSLKKLRTDCLDIYLMHWPASAKLYPDWSELNAETWRGMERLYDDGLVRAVGVCNFKPHHLEELKKTACMMPLINQIECHPGFRQKETVDFCSRNGIAVEASSPLGNGQILADGLLAEISQKHQKTAAQICLRWAVQQGYIAIPKTQNTDRLKENIAVFDFELSEKEMERINGMPYCGGIGLDADEVVAFG